MSELSSPPASDLAAARNIPSPRADAAQRIMQLARDYAVATADETDVDGINAAYLALHREVIASLRDGDDSARLERADAALSAAHEALTRHQNLLATDRVETYGEALTNGCDAAGAWGCFLDACWNIDERSVLDLIDAARTAPGGASNA